MIQIVDTESASNLNASGYGAEEIAFYHQSPQLTPFTYIIDATKLEFSEGSILNFAIDDDYQGGSGGINNEIWGKISWDGSNYYIWMTCFDQLSEGGNEIFMLEATEISLPYLEINYDGTTITVRDVGGNILDSGTSSVFEVGFLSVWKDGSPFGEDIGSSETVMFSTPDHIVSWTEMMEGGEEDDWSISLTTLYTVTLDNLMTVSSGEQWLRITACDNNGNEIWHVEYTDSTHFLYNCPNNNGELECINGHVVITVTSTSITFIGTTSFSCSIAFTNVAGIRTINDDGLFNGGELDISVSASGISPSPPISSVTVSPSSELMAVGESRTFTVTASGGTPPYTYQWCLDGSPVSGATSSTWTYTPDSASTHLIYCHVTDTMSQTADSNTVLVNVFPAQPSAGPYRPVYWKTNIIYNGVTYDIGFISGLEITAQYGGGTEEQYGSREKLHNIGVKSAKITFERAFYSDVGQESIFSDFFQNEDMFTINFFLINNVGARISSIFQFVNCRVYSWKPSSGGAANDIIIENCVVQAKDWAIIP